VINDKIKFWFVHTGDKWIYLIGSCMSEIGIQFILYWFRVRYEKMKECKKKYWEWMLRCIKLPYCDTDATLRNPARCVRIMCAFLCGTFVRSVCSAREPRTRYCVFLVWNVFTW
jgi:hypothetical protein